MTFGINDNNQEGTGDEAKRYIAQQLIKSDNLTAITEAMVAQGWDRAEAGRKVKEVYAELFPHKFSYEELRNILGDRAPQPKQTQTQPGFGTPAHQNFTPPGQTGMQPPAQPFQQPAATPFVQQTPPTQPVQQPRQQPATPQVPHTPGTPPVQPPVQQAPLQQSATPQIQQPTVQSSQPQATPAAAQSTIPPTVHTHTVTQQPAPTQMRQPARSEPPFVPSQTNFNPAIAHTGRPGNMKTIPWGYQAQQNMRYDHFKENYHSGPYMLYLLLGAGVFFISLIGTLLSFKIYMGGFAPMFYVGVVLGGVLAFVGFNRWMNSRGS